MMTLDTATAFINRFWPTAEYYATKKTNDGLGNIYQFSCPSDRYQFDFNMPGGWCLADNDQDAHYFADWLNPYELMNISYLEGEIYFVMFDNEADFIKHVNDYLNDDCFLGIDAPGDKLKQKFRTMGLGGLLHKEFNAEMKV